MMVIMMTISFTLAILLASVISFFVMMNPKVMKWYMKRVSKITEDVVNTMFDED